MPCPFCKQEHSYTVEEALDMLADGPRKVREAVASASEPELVLAEPKPGGWSASQVVTHLMDTEIVYSLRIRKILAEDEGVLPAFDQERWTAALGQGREFSDLLETFALLRKQNLGLLRAAPAGAMDRWGNHPEYGRLTLRDHVLHMAEHDSKHAAQIRRIRQV